MQTDYIKKHPQFRPSEKLIRATSRRRCPICNGVKRCSWRVDDQGEASLVICYKEASGTGKTASDGGWIHELKPRPPKEAKKGKGKKRAAAARPAAPAVAPIDHRHAVYTALLESLTLSGAHADDLLRRGLSDTEAARNLYASIPDSTARVFRVSASVAAQLDPSGVPGFFRYGDGWRFAAKRSGLFIPYRDVQGRIQACQIRQDSGTRYIWFSSADEEERGGTSSGAPVHFARPWRIDSTGEAIITEGALKADVTAEQLDCAVIAVPGVSSFRSGFGAWLKTQARGLQKLHVAYDADWRDNFDVMAALVSLGKELSTLDIAFSFLRWGRDIGKGIDDVLTKGGRA